MKSKQVVWATFTLINKSERCEKNPEMVNNSQINVAGATFAFFIKNEASVGIEIYRRWQCRSNTRNKEITLKWGFLPQVVKSTAKCDISI